jgi:hypothetical protein
MSPVATAPPRARALRIERPPVVVRREPRRREPLAIFAAAYAVYAIVGLYVTIGLDLVVGDAESRLAHAYFVWWNEPSKLAAIGFVWPPLQTLVLLPLAAVKPLATSLAALPLTSAAFAAGTLVVLDRTLALADVDRAARWALVGALGLNPLFVFYAINGMAEVVYLFFLSAAVAVFLRWSVAPRWSHLPLAGVAFALATLARYETALWLVLILVAVGVLLVQRRETADQIESQLLVLVVPAVYGLLLWCFLNWALTGNPFGFFSEQFPREAAGGPRRITTVELLRDTVVLSLALFPATPIVGGALLAVAVVRRHLAAAVLGLAILMNVALTTAFVLGSHEPLLLQLRYNIRALPLVLLGVALLLMIVPRRSRRLAAIGAVAVVAGSIPTTAAVMLTSEHELGEAAFLHGLVSGENQDGVKGPKGTGVRIGDQRDMAAFIGRHVRERNSILTDDARTYGVLLLDGHPERFLDRIDFGDRRWLFVRNHPVGNVRYVLVDHLATREFNPVDFDLIVAAYPGLADDRPPPFLQLLHRNHTYALYAVR